MQLTINQLFDLCTTKNLAVLDHEGLPFTSVISSDKYYFIHDDKVVEPFDFEDFFLRCINTRCYGALIAGECKIHSHGDVKWIGVTIYNKELEGLYSSSELSKIATNQPKSTYTTLRKHFVESKFQKDGCPVEDSKKESWDSMVASFYDGNGQLASEEFDLWLEKRNADRRPVVK
jgi:hypothetical protein